METESGLACKDVYTHDTDKTFWSFWATSVTTAGETHVPVIGCIETLVPAYSPLRGRDLVCMGL